VKEYTRSVVEYSVHDRKPTGIGTERRRMPSPAIDQYLSGINKRFRSGISREHAYRADLENLIRELVPGVDVTNEPANVTDCGNPDYVITKGKIPIGYIEAKDVGKDLGGKQHKEQFARYREALDNLIITDYVWFQFFLHGDLVFETRIGDVDGNVIQSRPDRFGEFEDAVRNFCSFVGQTVKSPRRLAEMMAAKARLLESILETAVTSDEKNQDDSALKQQYESFKVILIHDLDPKAFADIYAQTLAYGMFAARLHDPDLDTFSRQEAAELIPKTNPFLRRLFQYVAGYDIDERIRTTVDNLADVFRSTNVEALLKDFKKSTQTSDPIIHFYETFLAEYDPALRKSRGVWYTPEPVVKFIVRAVDQLLENEFGCKDGLADTAKTKIRVELQGSKGISRGKNKGKNRTEEVSVHKVQILDPATGTGTFLAEVVKLIHKKRFAAMQGAWSGYVDEDLIPRLSGFELLMASYSMAHLKLDLLLRETGYESKADKRFNIYLTNSLEEHHPDTGTLFASWLSREANEANHIKRDSPVMVVMGNPPYSISSANRGDWIQALLDDYKEGLSERKINIDDDYIKFIRYAHFMISKNGEGIVAYISNNSFLDGVTQRRMREKLLLDFDKVFILDLHGDVKKRVKLASGESDENVFDIMQGVSINIFVKNGSKKRRKYADLYHAELYGRRREKYNYLTANTMQSVEWSTIAVEEPYFFFSEGTGCDSEEYGSGFALNDVFVNYNSGIQTKNDSLTIQYNRAEMEAVVGDFRHLSAEELNAKYSIKEGAWKTQNAIDDVRENEPVVARIQYRPFDYRFTAITPKSNGFLGRPRYKTTKHFLAGENVGLICNRQSIGEGFTHIGVSACVTAHGTFYLGNRGQDYLLPLYTYEESGAQQSFLAAPPRAPNLKEEIVDRIAKDTGLTFVTEKQSGNRAFAPIDLLDYIYAVLYSPVYRETYADLLKIDFPRVPYPKCAATFWQLVELGSELRQSHLLNVDAIPDDLALYPVDGDNMVSRRIIKGDWDLDDAENERGRVWINDSQYFSSIPLAVWEMHFGGYQPAQKWLKDRLGLKLSYDDVSHYRRIISALDATRCIMAKIDRVDFLS